MHPENPLSQGVGFYVMGHGGGCEPPGRPSDLDGDASDEDALSATSDRLGETRRCLNERIFVRCVPVEMSPVLLVLSSGACRRDEVVDRDAS